MPSMGRLNDGLRYVIRPVGRSRMGSQALTMGLVAVVDAALAARYPGDRPLGYIVAGFSALLCLDRTRRFVRLPAEPAKERGHINSDPHRPAKR